MLLTTILLAGAGDYPGAAFLIDSDPKGYGLGIAGFGYSEGALATFYNPAGLSLGLKTLQHEVALNGMQFTLGIKGGEASIALPLPTGLTLGGRIFGYLTEVETYDSEGVSLGSVGVSSYIVEVAASLKMPFIKGLYGGARLKLNLDNLGDASIYNGALDLGAMYLIKKGEDRISIGGVFNNLGYSSAGSITYASFLGGAVYIKRVGETDLMAGLGVAYEVEPRGGVGFQALRYISLGGPKEQKTLKIYLGTSYEYFPSAAYLGYFSGLRAMAGVSYGSKDTAYELYVGARPMADFASYYSVSLRYIASLK